MFAQPTTLTPMKHLVTETVEVSRRDGIDKHINTYLNLGWVIIDSWIVGYGDGRERIETAHVLLGWIDRVTKPVHPPESTEVF